LFNLAAAGEQEAELPVDHTFKTAILQQFSIATSLTINGLLHRTQSSWSFIWTACSHNKEVIGIMPANGSRCISSR